MSKNILIVTASARSAASVSRRLAADFERATRDRDPEATIVHRNVGGQRVPHVTEAWIQSAFTPEASRSAEQAEALSYSDAVVAELHAADVVVIATPMYNWSIPSSLKAYFDQAIRMNETLSIDPTTPTDPYRGLLKNKRAVLLLSRGGKGYASEEFFHHMDFQTQYLKLVLRTLGIEDIETVVANGLDVSASEAHDSATTASQRVTELVQTI